MNPDAQPVHHRRRNRRRDPRTTPSSHALKQFLFIADQRIKTFNFYVIVLAASSATPIEMLTRLSQFERGLPAPRPD